MGKIVRFTFNVSRVNNGIFTLQTPLKNISAVNVSQIIFRHGPKKKSRKGKKRRKDDDSDDSDIPYENGNPDLMDATFILIKVNDFIRGHVYNEDGQLSDPYTVRLFSDLTDSGEGGWERSFQGNDWISNGQTANIEEICITTSTDLDPSVRHINYDIELEFTLES